MISIDCGSLEKEINILNELIEEYEQVFLNLFNEVNSSSFYWQDNLARNFYSNINIEKSNVKNSLFNLKNIHKVYNTLLSNYKNIANKITFYHENKNDIVNNLVSVENQFRNVNRQFNSLNTWFCTYSERNKISSLKTRFYNKYNQFISVKQSILEKMQDIEKIENQIKDKINSTDVLLVKEFINNEYL